MIGRDKYEQAILGLFTAGTSVNPDPHKADGKGERQEKVGCKRGIEIGRPLSLCRGALQGRCANTMVYLVVLTPEKA